MYFEMIYDESLAQASYFIGCQAAKVAAVIDPKRDIDTYIQIAEKRNMKITQIYETHIHADFLCGSRELAEVTGAEMFLSDEGDDVWRYDFQHTPLKHGTVTKLGNLKIETIHTPGHTPEHLSFLLTDTPASQEPVMLFTGDFVFVGDVGRPDLLEEAAGIADTKEKGALQMFDSLTNFNSLGDYIQLWPGHGAGSACGKALGAVPVSTIGYEKIRNWALNLLNDKNAFVEELLSGQPEPPKYFAMMKKLNKEQRPLLTSVPKWKKLDENDWQNAIKNQIKVIDTRNAKEFAEKYATNSINIVNNNSFSTWMGWFMDYNEDFIVVVNDENEVDNLTRKLMRIGLDNCKGYITFSELGKFKLELSSFETLNKAQLKAEIETGKRQLIDVRGTTEFESGTIGNAKHLFVGKLPQNLTSLNKDEAYIIFCQSGVRATIAHSYLKKHEFDVKIYTGGYSEWSQA